MEKRYFKPKSVTWWTGIVMLVSGALLSVDAGYSLGAAGDMLRTAAGDVGANYLILQGAALIGLRGALD